MKYRDKYSVAIVFNDDSAFYQKIYARSKEELKAICLIYTYLRAGSIDSLKEIGIVEIETKSKHDRMCLLLEEEIATLDFKLWNEVNLWI